MTFAAEPAALFDAHGCRSCHKIGDRGGNSGPDLTLVGVRRPRAWIEKWLDSPRDVKHGTLMPEQGLSLTNRGALSGFLSEQKGQAWLRRKPWDGASAPEKGRTIYVRAGCVACHGPAGRGGHPNLGAHGGIIPALAPLMSTYKKDELITKIRRGVVPETHDGPPAEVNMPGWEVVLTDAETDALADYLLSLSSADPKSDW
jgi:cytochrome c551/c552